VGSKSELEAALTLAGDKLVILEAYSEDACDLGLDSSSWEQAPTWNDAAHAHDAAYEPCTRLNHTIARVARECEDVSFITIDADESLEAKQLCAELGCSVMPTVQFWKNRENVYQVNGAAGADQEVGEGVLYYGDIGAGGSHPSDVVKELNSQDDLNKLVQECRPTDTKEKQLLVLDVSVEQGHPACMHAFPAVVALAKNMSGSVRWSRLLADTSDAAKTVAKDLNVDKYPTFVFFADGKQVGKYVGSDRVQLMQHVLQHVQENGIRLPKPPQRKMMMSTEEAKKIAAEKRKQARGGW